MRKWCGHKIGFGLFLVLIFLINSCSEDRAYSFFVAGHVYGSPASDSLGLYPSFKATFDDLNADELMNRGFLTGDMVKVSNSESWAAVNKDLRTLNMPVAMAPGNHDLTDYDLYKELYGEIGRYFFIEDDLFVIPEVRMDGWVISTEQLAFFTELVKINEERIENVFVFVHQIIFMDYLRVTPNSSEGKTDALNFESEVLPILESTNKSTVLFAGDIGAFSWGSNIFHERMNNVTYIASGMGAGLGDNYLIVDVQKDATVQYRIVSLNGTDLGKIDDY